jgi:hypothetical protein
VPMDLKSLLTNNLSSSEKELIVRELGDSERNFTTLLELALFEKDPMAWRAAWVLDGCDERHPELSTAFLSRIIRHLPETESMGTLRSMLRLLSRHEILEADQGALIDLCFGTMVSERFPVAVKVYAMQIIYNHVLIYPELKEELVSVIRDQSENNSAGFKARGTLILKQLEKIL